MWRCPAGPGHKIAKTSPCKVGWTPARSTLAALRPRQEKKKSNLTSPPFRVVGSLSQIECGLLYFRLTPIATKFRVAEEFRNVPCTDSCIATNYSKMVANFFEKRTGPPCSSSIRSAIGDRIMLLRCQAKIARDVSFDADTGQQERELIRSRIGDVLAA